MASSELVVTIDTASSPWVYSDGLATTVSSTDQVFHLYMTDQGTTSELEGIGSAAQNEVLLADGNRLHFSSDKRMVHLGDGLANATAKISPGSLWVSVDGGPEEEVKVTTITLADADATTGANNLTAITFEYPGKPYKWSWATLQMEAA